jgi:acetyl-CoA carboxylase biotin carboxyl carrier protein
MAAHGVTKTSTAHPTKAYASHSMYANERLQLTDAHALNCRSYYTLLTGQAAASTAKVERAGPMNQEELKELIYFLSQKDISEFSLERADSTVRIKRNIEPQLQVVATPLALQSSGHGQTGAGITAGDAAAQTAVATEEEELHILKSPMVGIFQRGAAAGGRPFVAQGDLVEAGQVVGMVEVLRLMHEVQSDISGQIVEIAANDREPVEYGQPLFAIRPATKPN